MATPEGRILFANKALEKKLGYTAEDLASMHVLDIHPADKRREAGEIFAAMFRGERESCPLPVAAKNGALLPVETRVWFGKWNGADCVFGVSKDLSEEQEAKQRFERLFRNNPCPMALSLLPDRSFFDINDAFLSTLGYARNEVVGKTARDLGLFVDEGRMIAVAEAVQATGRVSNYELQVRRKDGSIIDGIFSGETIGSQGRKYLLTVMLDFSELKRAERKLARLSEIQHELTRLATHFINVPTELQDDAIRQSLETMGRLIHADRAYLFRYDFGAGITSNTHEWCETGITPEIDNLQAVPLDTIPEWVEAHRRGDLVHIPCVASLPEDSALRKVLEPQGIQSLITLPLIRGADCLGFVGFDAVREARNWGEEESSLLRVLAELYAHFKARRAAEREARLLQDRLLEARDEAQAAVQAKNLFLANMSHEIRTPLNAVLGYAQIMEHECRECPSKRRLHAIARSGEHLLELITDLMNLACSDAQSVELAPQEFDFYQALDDVRNLFTRHSEAQGLTLTVSLAPEVPRIIRADPGKVRQILVNLVGNAVKFTPQGGVRLSGSVVRADSPDPLTLAVEVEDTGPGISNDEQDRIFDLFYTNARNPQKGTGLGLPLSRRYARALGGDITVTSRLGTGSCFRFTFLAQAADGNGSQKRIVRRLAPNARALRILTVDDDPASREVINAMLTAVGFNVETAVNATQALYRLCEAEAFDLVLMDKRMPDMDGFEAIRRLRELPGREEVRVLMVTASGFADEREYALAAGADGYIPKPVRRDRLLEEIGRIAGARYEYELEPVAHQETDDLTPETMAQVPEEWRLHLDQALRRGDIRRLRDLVEIIAHDHARAAAGIRALVDVYAYDRLRRILDSAKEKTP